MIGRGPYLWLNAVSHSYQGEEVIHAITLEVRSREVLAIMAPSGAGKSTLLRVALGLETPMKGSVGLGVERADIGVVFQEDSLLPWLDVIENIYLFNKLTAKAVEPNVLKAHIGLFGLRGFESHLPRALSTGMKQKVAICRVLVYGSPLIVVDEGMANIDDLLRFKICDLLRKQVKDTGGAMLLVTHNPTDALHLADRILLGSDRPLRIVNELNNPLPAERDSAIRFSPEFREALEELRNVQNDP